MISRKSWARWNGWRQYARRWAEHSGENFSDNLHAYRNGMKLHNVIDWQRGY
jgi:hypothetical protein